VIDKIAARVNEDIILMSEVKGKSFIFLYDMKNKGKEIKDEDIYKVEKEVLNEMVEERLMLQFANDNNIKASDEDIKTAIEDIKKQNNFTDEMLEQELNKENMTLNDYKERLREQITVSRVVNYEVRSKAHVEEAEVRKYYEEHRDEFATPEEIRVRHIMFAYTEDMDSQKEEAIKKKAVDILNRIRQGEDFASLASMYSEDASAKNGGDLGYFTRGKMIKIFEDTAFALKKGEVSDVIKTPFGFHILKCEDIRESAFKPFEEASKEIEKKIFNEKIRTLKDAWVKKMREKAFIEILY
jgi:peptidyl-prolyl cis-trans isomerase SurA